MYVARYVDKSFKELLHNSEGRALQGIIKWTHVLIPTQQSHPDTIPARIVCPIPL
jgi:hypothetical protein